jgi:serine phosphatase RsbU (regulator of sigma subunit)
MNAGHPAPYLITENEPVSLPTTGMIIGAFPKMELHRSFVFMSEGSVLVSFSDGITERTNPEGEFFGNDRLIEAVTSVRDKSAEEILQYVFGVADAFGEGMKWDDDATILILKRLPKPTEAPVETTDDEKEDVAD